MLSDPTLRGRIATRFPFIQSTDAGFRDAFFGRAQYLQIGRGQVVAMEGDRCQGLALVLSGSVRIYKMTPSGRELTLYHIPEGDSCVLTASCIMSDSRFPATAETETDVELIIVPSISARDWLSGNDVWCAFVFGLVSKRLASIILTLEDVAFLKMNVRLAHYLIENADSAGALHVTHQHIADELGTSREVVTRLLKEFENDGLLETHRGNIVIRDAAGIQALD